MNRGTTKLGNLHLHQASKRLERTNRTPGKYGGSIIELYHPGFTLFGILGTASV